MVAPRSRPIDPRQGAHHQKIERAVFVIGRKQPVERKQAREQGAEPKDRRSDAREQRQVRPNRERHHGYHDQEEQRAYKGAAADANRQPQVTNKKSRESAHAGPNFSSRARSRPIGPCAAATIMPPSARWPRMSSARRFCDGASTPGMAVTFAQETGDQGPQAIWVQPL